jgi:hypothetical protein
MRLIWLKVIPETIKAAAQKLSFQCNGGETPVSCTITVEAVGGLVQFHGLDVNKDQAAHVLLREIERLANEKFSAGRVGQNGEFAINATDVLRYGFHNIDIRTHRGRLTLSRCSIGAIPEMHWAS